MKTLNQSAIVKQSGCYPVQIVLCEVGGVQPFVTWIRVIPDDSEVYNVHGHYFRKQDDAAADYDERVASLGRRR